MGLSSERAEEIRVAKIEGARLVAEGMNPYTAARKVGLHADTLRRALYPHLAENMRKQSLKRQRKYGRPCLICGETTTGSMGRDLAPSYCLKHYRQDPSYIQKQSKKNTASKEKIISKMQEWAELYGNGMAPRGTDWNLHNMQRRGDEEGMARLLEGDWPWFSHVYHHFSSWQEAADAAGLKLRPRYPGGMHVTPKAKSKQKSVQRSDKYWTKEKVLSKILEWNQLYGQPPKSTEWLKPVEKGPDGYRLWPGVTEVQAYFGSWNQGLIAAGLTPRSRKSKSTTKIDWTNEKIIEMIQIWHARTGLAPTKTDWDKDRNYPRPNLVQARFGSWQAAIKAAGLIPLPTGVTKKAISAYLPLKKEDNA